MEKSQLKLRKFNQVQPDPVVVRVKRDSGSNVTEIRQSAHFKSKLCQSTNFQPALVFATAILVYANALPGDFLHDDVPAVLRNPDVQGEGNLWEIFKNDFWGTSMKSDKSHKSYRPICVLLFRLQILLFGNNACAVHLVSVLLHALVSAQVFLFCKSVVFKFKANKTALSLVGGLMFAVHPIHTEAVTNVVGQAELWSALCYIIAIRRYSQHINQSFQDEDQSVDNSYTLSRDATNRQTLPAIEAVVVIATGTLCKETCITALAMLFLEEIAKFKRSRKWGNKLFYGMSRCVIITSSLLVMMYFRLKIMDWKLPVFADADNPVSKHRSVKVRGLTYSYLSSVNLGLLLVPITLCYDWSYDTIPLVKSFYDARNIQTIFTGSFVLGLMLYSIYGMYCNQLEVVYGTAMLIVPYIPASNLFFPVGFVIAERTLYAPSIGLVILFACLFDQLQLIFKSRKIVVVLAIVTMTLYATRTCRRNQDWRSKESLFHSGVETFPHNAKIRYNWANFLRNEKRFNEAIQEYETVLELYPRYSGALNNLAILLEENPETRPRAKELYARLIRMQPGHVQAYRNLANLFVKDGKYDSAINVLSKLLELKDDNADYGIELALFMQRHNMTLKSQRVFVKILNLCCDLDEEIYRELKKFTARKKLKFEIKNTDLKCLNNKTQICTALVGLASTLGRNYSTLALKIHKKCLEFIQSDSAALTNLAVLFLRNDEDEKARETLRGLFAENDGSMNIVWEKAFGMFQEEEIKISLVLYEELHRHYIDNVDISQQFATLLFANGHSRASVVLLSNLVALDQPCLNIDIHKNLAAVYGKLSRHKEAIDVLENCVKEISSKNNRQNIAEIKMINDEIIKHENDIINKNLA